MNAAILPSIWMIAAPPRLRVVGGAQERRERDADLVERMRGGNRSAEEACYREYAPQILALTTRLLSRRSDAEDATQDTFILAFENLAQLRDAKALRAWLVSIAVSQARRRLRKRKMLRTLGLHTGADDATLDSLVSPGASAEVKSDLSALHRVLKTLPVEQRIAWVLRYVEGEELTDVAEACGCSLATVKRRIAAADVQVHAEVRLGDDGEAR
jgi:RNA polymerase sigma-70 factor (ECF subfamily)